MTEEEAGESPEETRRRFEEANQAKCFAFGPTSTKLSGQLLAKPHA